MIKSKQIHVADFIQKERNRCLCECAFTDIENELFLLRCRGKTIEESAEIMNVSSKTAYRINKRIKNKIGKVYGD